MNVSLKFLGRGLLVLALGGYAIGCGDDDSTVDSDLDGGGTGGTGGTGGAGKGSGGSNGKDAGGGGGTGGSMADGGTPTMAACVAAVNTATAGMTAAACAACVCENGPVEATACTTGCWSLVKCYGANCADTDPSDMTAASTCALANCSDAIAMPGYMGATPLGKVISASCSDVCTASPAGDGGSDDGGT